MEKARIIFWIAHIIYWSGFATFNACKNTTVKAVSWSITCVCLGVMITTPFF